MLPPSLVAMLGLRWQRFGRGVLADGSESLFDVYEAKILWDGRSRLVAVYEIDGDPLIGMSMMYGYELMLPVLDGATFTLRHITDP